MSDRNKIVELLKNYRSYKYAVSNGIAPYIEEDNTGMPFNSSYGSRQPILFRGSLDASTDDYRRYTRVVRMIDGAVQDVLNDTERDIIQLKYLDRNSITLERIAERKGYCERQVRRIHKRAITRLTLALTFLDAPEIINLDAHLQHVL